MKRHNARRARVLPVAPAALAMMLCCISAPSPAQEPQIDEGGHKLVLSKMPDIETGLASLISSSTGPEGDKFYVEHLTMFQPAMVVLIAADVTKPLKLKLAKYRYDETAWEGDTGDVGTVSHRFRTQGELKIHVEPEDAEPGSRTDYYLIAWAAELPEPDLPPPVTVIGASGGGGGIPMWAKIGGGIAVLVAVAAVFFRMGRKS